MDDPYYDHMKKVPEALERNHKFEKAMRADATSELVGEYLASGQESIDLLTLAEATIYEHEKTALTPSALAKLGWSGLHGFYDHPDHKGICIVCHNGGCDAWFNGGKVCGITLGDLRTLTRLLTR